MPRDQIVFLQDMMDAISKIESYSNGFSTESLNDAKTRDAILRNLEIVGEAAKSIDEDVRS